MWKKKNQSLFPYYWENDKTLGVKFLRPWDALLCTDDNGP